MKIEVEQKPSDTDRQTLSKAIGAFNDDTIPDLEPLEAEQHFHVLARNDEGVLVGGIRATCYWNTLHIELLWLDERLRGSGIGRDILAAAEEFARAQSCENAFVETTSWQAKPFYERNGYVLMGTLEGRPKGHASHYLSKSLG